MNSYCTPESTGAGIISATLMAMDVMLRCFGITAKVEIKKRFGKIFYKASL